MIYCMDSDPAFLPVGSGTNVLEGRIRIQFSFGSNPAPVNFSARSETLVRRIHLLSILNVPASRTVPCVLRKLEVRKEPLGYRTAPLRVLLFGYGGVGRSWV